MLGLLGRVGGAQKAAAQPAAKRQKRADVLDSLGLGSAAGSGLGLGKSLSAASTATAKPATNQKSSDQKALQEWLAAEENSTAASTPQEAPVQQSAEAEGGKVTEQPFEQPAADWRAPFAEATDRWFVEESSGRVRYFASDQKLYFEWEKEMGVLYQYFPEESQEATHSEPSKHPVWSADCPEMHAEVWEVLPLPPGAPTTEVRTLPPEEPADEELSRDIAEGESSEEADDGGMAEPVKAEAKPASAPAALASDASMMPPPAVPRKRPAPPPTFAEAESSEGSAASSSSAKALQEADDDVKMEGAMQGPQLPSQQATEAEEEEDDGGADVLQLLGDDSDDEPLGKEDCALPAAPSERVEPTAKDLELDMFAD
mmetsp:Transcript_56335/g.104194  ORF Transcript_56335/g.104194 Transcript_56335/m.104194 type:complete len:372 (+) Transcript_56335:63-1178(+)